MAARLPQPLSFHCMVRLNQNEAMVIGGAANVTKAPVGETYIYNFQEDSWTSGPRLIVSQNKCL